MMQKEANLANIIDYIDWRGDIDFTASPFNEIDAVILCQITYLNFEGLQKGSYAKADCPKLFCRTGCGRQERHRGTNQQGNL